MSGGGRMRVRAQSAKARVLMGPREGTFAAHQPSSWTVSSAATGSHYTNPAWKPVRPRPQSGFAKVMANPHIREGVLTSECRVSMPPAHD